jgi:hypothetical protein
VDPFQRIVNRPPVKQGRGKVGSNPFIVGRENIQLSRNLRTFVSNFGEKKENSWETSLFQGDPREKCHYPGGCGTPLETSNHYIYCRRHLNSALDYFIQAHPNDKQWKYFPISINQKHC